MNKGEIQAEAEKYAEKWKQFASNHFEWISKGYTDGILSDTARKHWEPKWIPVTGEGLPKESKMYIVRSSDSELPFVDFFKSDLEMFDFDIRHKFTSKRITHYSPLPTFND